MQGNIAGRISGAWRTTYNRSAGFIGQIIPQLEIKRAGNPYIAAGLELFGFIGLMGLGRIYAGDTHGGIRTLLTWFVTYWVMNIIIYGAGLIAVIAAIFTIGFSLLAWGIFALPALLSLYAVPISSAIKLFSVMKR